MKLSIIIVSWNTADLTLKCLKSIFRYIKNIDYQVFLVDNNSSDGTVEVATELIHEQKHKLKIIENKENFGFAKANNIAIKQAQGEYILLLNSDTELLNTNSSTENVETLRCSVSNKTPQRGVSTDADDKSGILQMVDFMEQNPDIGILGPKLLNTNGTLQRSCRRFPKLIDQFFIQLKFYNFFPEKIKSIREYFMFDFKHDKICEVDQIMGAAMLIKKQVFNKIGLLDENFWAIFEEVDFCKRARDADYKIYFYPDTQIMHHKEQSFKKMNNLKKQINFNHSLYYYFKKHKLFWQLFILWLVQPINLFLTILDSIFKIRKRKGKRKDL